MTLKILTVSLAAAAAGCVFHHEVKSGPERDRLELSAQADGPAVKAESNAAYADAVGR